MNIKKTKDGTAFILIKKRKTKLKNYFYLSADGNLDEAAKNLYSCFRKIKNKGYMSIAVEKIPNKGLGKTINDRLHRAAKF
jgi:L-threonylcarbamoyladenylate synthase